MFGLFKSKPQVLVAGAGPVGLYAALNLAQRGIKVEVIDEEWRSTTRSYALALHPRSLELFDQLGLTEAILSSARKVHRVGFYEGNERRAELDFRQLPALFPYIAILPQSDVENLLVRALGDAGVKVQYNHRLAAVESHSNHVKVRIDTLGKETVGYGVAHTEKVIERSQDLEVPFVLAADGHESLARKQSRIKFESVRPAQHFAVFEFTASGDLPEEVCVVLDEQTTNVLWPMSDRHYRWSFQLDELDAPADSRDKDRLLASVGAVQFPHLEQELMNKLLAQRAPWFKGHVEDVLWRIEVRFEYRLASSFGAGRVWLAGDAAHMAGPVGVQSMNSGLREAHELCDLYTDVLNGQQSPAALNDYDRRRRDEWGTLLGTGPNLEPGKQTPPWIAERAARLIECVPASGEHLASLLGQLDLRASA